MSDDEGVFDEDTNMDLDQEQELDLELDMDADGDGDGEVMSEDDAAYLLPFYNTLSYYILYLILWP